MTGPELTWWNSVKGSPWLTDETVGLFLRLPGSRARRDLLCLASEDPDGSPTYHQASASWSAGGRPCRPAVPRCVAIVGKGPWSNEQRLRAVSSQAVRSGALSARHGDVLRYPWTLGTCSPLVRVTFAAILHPTCAPAPTLSVLALSWPRCDLHCARVCCVLRWVALVLVCARVGCRCRWLGACGPAALPVLLRHQAPQVRVLGYSGPAAVNIVLEGLPVAPCPTAY